MHSHGGIEIVFHPSGRGVTNCADGRSLEFGPGDVIVYPPGVAHDQRMIEQGIDNCLQVSMREASEFPVLDKAFRLEMIRSQTALSALSDISCWADSEPPVSKDLRAAAILLTLLQENLESKRAGRLSSGLRLALDARAIAVSELSDPPSSVEIARRLGLSQDHLRHLIRHHFGKGLKELSLEARMARAMNLLSNSPMTLKEIAAETGFAHERALCAAFKMRLGHSPGQFRLRSSAPPA
jgi:AraC-like DNA-binding protein